MSERNSIAGGFSETDASLSADLRPEIQILPPSRAWTPENFARQQIRGLVRQVFFSNAVRPIRQVIFSPAESQTDVGNLCQLVGRALAAESTASVAVVGQFPMKLKDLGPQGDSELAGTRDSVQECDASMPLRAAAIPVRNNLWLVPALAEEAEFVPDAKWHTHLCEVRREFEYSIIEGPPAGESNEAIAMAQLADGIILVLSARHTRRAAARAIKERLVAAQARILGTVLTDRQFPMPESIYKRL